MEKSTENEGEVKTTGTASDVQGPAYKSPRFITLRQNIRMSSNLLPTPQALEIIQTLVRMNTVSSQSNLELIYFARDLLARLGVKSRITSNADKTKANLFATLGEGKKAGVILSGHTDTVPWDGQAWTHDPLSAKVIDGKLYGRGSCDMKGFIGLALAHRLPCTWP
jgi:acetylornithine deacetylase